jgi:hypothetical protein
MTLSVDMAHVFVAAKAAKFVQPNPENWGHGRP